MKAHLVAVLAVIVGIVLMATSPLASPQSGFLFGVSEVNESEVPDDAEITDYEELSPEMQDLFDEARPKDSSVYVGWSEPQWYESPGYVGYEGTYYHGGGTHRLTVPEPHKGPLFGGLLLMGSGIAFFIRRAVLRFRD